MGSKNLLSIIKYAYDKNASDIHIKLDNYIFYRIGGKLIKSNKLVDKNDLNDYLRTILTNDELNTLFTLNDINKTLSIGNIRLRCNVFISCGQPSIAIRLIDDYIVELESLDIYTDIIRLIDKMNGLVLITGISGSGKTMTMNSIVDYINKNYSYNILMIEDPIEYLHKSNKSLINQREVLKDTKSYSEGLESSLREDPDVIFLGEMRSLSSIKIALTAAETGHLVFSTLHTMGGSKTIDRIIDVFPSSQQNQIRLQVSTVLKAVFAQKLKLVDEELLKREAIFEKIIVDAAISNLIRENKTYQINNISKIKQKR